MSTIKISRRAKDLYKQLLDAPPDQFWAVHEKLHEEIGAPPWEWPLTENAEICAALSAKERR